VHSPKERSRDRQEDGCQRIDVEHAKPKPEKDQECAGVGRVTNVAIRPGGDQLMVFRDRDVDGEETAKMDDRDPADDEADRKNNKADNVKRARVGQPSTWECFADVDSGENT
jgi:hypothetical protein